MRRSSAAPTIRGLLPATLMPAPILSALATLLGTTTRVSFLALLGRSAMYTLVGLLLVPLAVVVLYANEGLPDRAALVERAAVLGPDADRPSRARLSTVTGELAASGTVGDPDLIAPGPWIELTRWVEVYAWHEVIQVTEEKRWGGWRDRHEDVDYVLAWTIAPPDSSTFRDPSRVNAPPPLPSERWRADGLRVGTHPLRAAELLPMPGARRLLLDQADVRLPPGATRTGSAIWLRGDPAQPQAGDVRVRFQVVEPGALVTFLGDADKGGLGPHTVGGMPVQELAAGTRDALAQTLRTEDRLRLALLRLLGVLAIWVGLGMLGSMLYAVLDIAPPVGTAARIVAAVATLPIAGLLGFGTIALGVLGHNRLYTALVLGGMLAVIVVLYYVLPLFRRAPDGDPPRDVTESTAPSA